MFRTPFLCALLFCIVSASAQQPVLEWATQWGPSSFAGSGWHHGRSIAVDSAGNVYSAGVFLHTVDFDPGPGVYYLTAPGRGIYISKLTASGAFVWAKSISLGLSGLIDLDLDDQANVYLTAYISAPTDMDPGPGIYMPVMVGRQDAFILKLDSNGDFLWEKQFGGPEIYSGASGSGIEVDPTGHVILSGSFHGTVDCDPGAGYYPFTGIGVSEVFIVKLTPDGNFVWARRFGDFTSKFGSVGAPDIKCDRLGNVYTTGVFNRTCDFDSGPGSAILTSAASDGYVCKLDARGNFVWVKRLGNSTDDSGVQPGDLDIDVQNTIYITGSVSGTHDLDPGPGVHSLASNGESDAFILKLNSNGGFIWVKGIGGISSDRAWDIVVDNSSNAYILGSFSKAVDFNPGPGAYLLNLYYDAVVLKLDVNGNFIFAANFPEVGSGSTNGTSLVTDAAQNVYVTGGFGGSIDFDPGPGNFNMVSGVNGTDIFIVKLARCLNRSASTITATACDRYALNGDIFDSSGVYTQLIGNAAGCDSLITLHLTITRKFTQQTKTLCHGESIIAGGAKQSGPGQYVDTLKTDSGCDSIVTTTLIIHPLPVPNIGPDRTLCADSTVALRPGGFASYLWQDGNTQPYFTAAGPGLYTVKVLDTNNCWATDSVRITTVTPPANFLRHSDSLCTYESVMVAPRTGYAQYLWSTGAQQSNITVAAPGTYWLRVKDGNGCSGIDTITVFPKQCLQGVFIPTAFTPNSDGKNDNFKPLLYGNVKSYRLFVYNRWGHIVFQTTDLQKAWDGRQAGIAQPTGAFIWVCVYQFEREDTRMQKGTVTLIR